MLAAPVMAAAAVRELMPEVDRLVSLLTPSELYAIGLWYEDFTQVSDEEVARLLDRARQEQTAAHHVVA